MTKTLNLENDGTLTVPMRKRYHYERWAIVVSLFAWFVGIICMGALISADACFLYFFISLGIAFLGSMGVGFYVECWPDFKKWLTEEKK